MTKQIWPNQFSRANFNEQQQQQAAQIGKASFKYYIQLTGFDKHVKVNNRARWLKWSRHLVSPAFLLAPFKPEMDLVMFLSCKLFNEYTRFISCRRILPATTHEAISSHLTLSLSLTILILIIRFCGNLLKF